MGQLFNTNDGTIIVFSNKHNHKFIVKYFTVFKQVFGDFPVLDFVSNSKSFLKFPQEH